MKEVTVPFLFVNPKSYLYGGQSLELALAADKISEKYGVTVFFTCPYADLRMIAERTSHVIVTAQSMDSLRPGRGMGAVLPESLVEAGAKAVVLNHAENQKTLAELNACMERAKELGLITIVCADSTVEAKAVAELGANVILAEPTELIGTGTTAGVDYIVESTRAIKAVSPETKVMIAYGRALGLGPAELCLKIFGALHSGLGGGLGAFEPAVVAMEANASKGMLAMLRSAQAAAEAGVESTKNFEAKFGRAKTQGTTIGFQDAGATSVWVIMKAMADFIEKY